jgi:hypothetical protein
VNWQAVDASQILIIALMLALHGASSDLNTPASLPATPFRMNVVDARYILYLTYIPH